MPAERKKELYSDLFGDEAAGYGQSSTTSGHDSKDEAGYEEKKEEAYYAGYEDKKEPLPYHEPGAPSPSGAYYEPGAPSPSGAYYEPGAPSASGAYYEPGAPSPSGAYYDTGAPSPSGAYDYQSEAQTRREAQTAQLDWMTASEEMMPASSRRSEVQQA